MAKAIQRICNKNGLINANRCPKGKRQSQISQRVFAYRWQETIFNQCQEVKDFIANYCKKHGNTHEEIKPHIYTLALLKHQNV
jgi:hypothetical protein